MANLIRAQLLSQLYWFFIPGAAYIYMATEEDFMRVGDLLNRLDRVPEVRRIMQELEETATVPE